MQDNRQDLSRTTSDPSITSEKGPGGGGAPPFQIDVECASIGKVSYYRVMDKHWPRREIKCGMWKVKDKCAVTIIDAVATKGGRISKKRLDANDKILFADIDVDSDSTVLEYELCLKTPDGKCLAYGEGQPGPLECVPCDSGVLRPEPPPKVIIEQ